MLLCTARYLPAAISSLGGQSSDLLRQIKSATFQKRLYMKPYFKDYDKHNNCRVTKTQFLAVLDLMGININANEKELLVRAFQHKEGRLVTSDVDYKRFVRRVDQVEQK
jgi:Ca2+-binding EF-hand superfamily protein